MSGALAALGAALLVLPLGDTARARLLKLGGTRHPRRLWAGMHGRLSAPLWLAVAAGMVTFALGGVPGGALAALPVAVFVWWLTCGVLRRRKSRSGGAEFLRTAASLDLMAACLRAGLPVPIAVRVIAAEAPAPVAEALRSTADLLDLGADHGEAWAPVRGCPGIAELARAAGRTARSGTALADVAADLSDRLRGVLSDQAETSAQRAGVLITGPLGLCFLPAFLCLGVVPVVIGLASRLTVAR